MPLPDDVPPVHEHLTFLSPLSDARADALAEFVATAARGTVVDVGCGWAELLVRVLERGAELRGLGVDLDGERIDHGRRVAEARGVSDRLELIAGDAQRHVPRRVGGALCIGATQAWSEPSDTPRPLDVRGALDALRARVERGSPVVYGDGIWSAEPTPDAIAPLGGRRDEFVTLPELLDVARTAGFAVNAAHEASLDEWDAFESGFAARFARWLADHPADHPDADAVRQRLEAQQRAYHGGYRGVLGLAYLELLAV